jgi:hypothetical protein
MVESIILKWLHYLYKIERFYIIYIRLNDSKLQTYVIQRFPCRVLHSMANKYE